LIPFTQRKSKDAAFLAGEEKVLDKNNTSKKKKK
jgi:hypothetical protein